ncbi:hypothetical protein CsatB_008645 [Cannabis sativa]|uniref:MADS-box domain-containing protein n=1 Tax=Cannabis sativa TaxID=3483 RepID=A0A7J6H7H0_CANSA|nr:hypothetical protein F8388_015022 [Cannabis sativa]KAF4390399.1 hypothetical protein G4B88_024405 [Cannabis sativa]
MGRGKLPLELIPKVKARRMTFLKRKSCLIKKAYELSTLCNVKVCLIVYDSMNQSSDPIATWPENPHEIRSLINDYKTAMAQKPDSKRLHTIADFIKEKIKKVNTEIEKLDQTSTTNTPSTSTTSFSNNQLVEFVSDLDNKIEQVNERMRHLIHLNHYNNFGMQDPFMSSCSVQYCSPNDHQLPYYNDNEPQILLQQQHQMPWIYDQSSSSSSSKAPLFTFNPSLSFDMSYHYNNCDPFDYAIDEYYNGNNLLLEDQANQHNNNIVLESERGVGAGLHQNDQNGMMLSHNPLMPMQHQNYNVSQTLLPLMPSSTVDTEWHYNQAIPLWDLSPHCDSLENLIMFD